MKNNGQLSPKKYIHTKARTLPINDCLIDEELQERGIGSIILSRKMPSGNLIVGIYLLDIFCLGLKNTLYKFNINNFEYEELLEHISKQQNLIPCEPEMAHNLIYGAIDYAEELGFSPNKDFEITEYILDPELISDGIDELEFGRNGKPLYFVGPDDNVNKIMAILEKNVGIGNFDYVMPDEEYYD